MNEDLKEIERIRDNIIINKKEAKTKFYALHDLLIHLSNEVLRLSKIIEDKDKEV